MKGAGLNTNLILIYIKYRPKKRSHQWSLEFECLAVDSVPTILYQRLHFMVIFLFEAVQNVDVNVFCPFDAIPHGLQHECISGISWHT